MNDVQRIKAIYNFEKVDHLPRIEFGIWEETKKRWMNEGWNGDQSVFKFDKSNGMIYQPVDLGGVDAPIVPPFEEIVLETTDKYEIVQLKTGEVRMYPIGQRHGFNFVFVRAPVRSEDDWYGMIKPRLSPETPQRWTEFTEKMLEIKSTIDSGEACMSTVIIGGYMYLRSLCGPQKLLYMFYDFPELLHDMMETWLKFNIYSLSKIQDATPIFRLYMAEDIAFKTGPLISPKLVEEFLIPYYNQLINTLRSRQKERLHFELDCDGNPEILLPLYIKSGFTAWSPCEIVAGCDPVRIAKKFPELVISGGINKLILAKDKDSIKRELDRIIPFMKTRGGYIPTCDGEVPDNVPFENYLFYREYITSMDT
jgi:hypothetical protein